MIRACWRAASPKRWYYRGRPHGGDSRRSLRYRYLRGKVERIVVEMEKIAVNFADSLGADPQPVKRRRRRRSA